MCRNKLDTYEALRFSALRPLPHTVLSNNSPSSSLRLSICLRLGQVTALRELRPNPTPTQLTHIIPAIFHKKGTFDINQPPSLSSLSLMCAQKTHIEYKASFGLLPCQSQINRKHANRDNNAKQNAPSPVAGLCWWGVTSEAVPMATYR